MIFFIEMKKIVYKFTTYNLQNYPTFHSLEKLVNSVRRRKRLVCLSSSSDCVADKLIMAGQASITVTYVLIKIVVLLKW